MPKSNSNSFSLEKKEPLKFNWSLVGNSHITEFLEKSLARKNVGGTYIFNGPDNLGKTTVANCLAQILLCQNYKENSGEAPCNTCPSCRHFFAEKQGDQEEVSQIDIGRSHGDFHVIKREKDKKNISIEQVRNFIRTLNLSSFLGSYKIGIIKHAESLSMEAANALLKTLEEPKENVVIILVTSDIESLPQTIVSRSRVLNFFPVKSDLIYDYLVDNYKTPRSQAKNLSRLCLGRPALAVKFLENKDFYDKYFNKVNVFLNFWSQDINERFKAVEDLMDKKAASQETVKETKRTLETWQGVIRDCLLLEYGHGNLIQNQTIEEKVSNTKNGLGASNALNLVRILNDSFDYLEANVNPKLVLENIAVSI